MRKYFLTYALSLIVLSLAAQSRDDVKIGLGASFLGTGDMLIGKVEVEGARKWNRIISNSLSVGVGYGDNKYYYHPPADYHNFRQQTFTAHLDGNVFVSPLGNERLYNLKLGTGISLMYAADTHSRPYRATRRDSRASVGLNMILEQELMVTDKSLIGLKMMIQPYINGDIASTLLFKFGRRL